MRRHVLGDVLKRLVDSGGARVVSDNAWEDGPHRLYEATIGGERLMLLHSGVGAPLAAGLLDELIARGCRAFIVCGGAGTLQADTNVGHLIIVTSALRDEGTSYHYAPPSRVIDSDAISTSVLAEVLAEREMPFVTGRVWTTDAPYRETPDKVQRRREEGCVAVEMEAAALAAVAAFRGVRLAHVIYAGDDLSGDVWEHRGWQSHAAVRDELVQVAAHAAVRVAAVDRG